MTACSIDYIGRIDASDFDPVLRDAISAKLASDAASPLVGSSSLVQMMYQTNIEKINQAMEASVIEGSSPVLVSNRMERIRK